ncbi:MAG: hypothetical protein AB9861_20580 [Methanosarcina sp.]
MPWQQLQSRVLYFSGFFAEDFLAKDLIAIFQRHHIWHIPFRPEVFSG